jgi:hypothetical protein
MPIEIKQHLNNKVVLTLTLTLTYLTWRFDPGRVSGVRLQSQNQREKNFIHLKRAITLVAGIEQQNLDCDQCKLI